MVRHQNSEIKNDKRASDRRGARMRLRGLCRCDESLYLTLQETELL